MTTFVLVHGAWHGGWCWDRVAPLLRAAGHEVHAPTLTGLSERGHLLSPLVSPSTSTSRTTSSTWVSRPTNGESRCARSESPVSVGAWTS